MAVALLDVALRTCTQCGVDKPRTSEFFYVRPTRDGLSPRCRVCECERVKAWAVANPGRVAQRSAQWRKDFPERKQESNARWYRENTAAHRELVYAGMARRAAAAGFASAEQIMARVAYYGFKCWMCGCDWEQIDHVIPLRHGGTNWPSNLRPACKPCNSSKKDRPYRLFLRKVA